MHGWFQAARREVERHSTLAVAPVLGVALMVLLRIAARQQVRIFRDGDPGRISSTDALELVKGIRHELWGWIESWYGKGMPVQWLGSKPGGSVIEIGARPSGDTFVVREGRKRGLSEKALESLGNRNCATFWRISRKEYDRENGKDIHGWQFGPVSRTREKPNGRIAGEALRPSL